MRELLDAWEDAPEGLSEDAADELEPIRRTIESSVSYRYAREETHKKPLPTRGRIRRVHFLDRLERLADADPQAADLVKLRYFSGLTVPQAADVLGVSTRTAERLWTYAKAYLLREIRDI